MKSPRHKVANAVLIVTTLLSVCVMLYGGIQDASQGVLTFRWHWFAIPVMLGLLVMVVSMGILFRYSSSRKGAFYWFVAFNISTTALLVLVLLQTLSATSAAATFWQGFLPVTWLTIPMFIFFFVNTYVDDTDLPSSLGTFTAMLFGVFALLAVAAGSNVIERHANPDAVLEYWGWQNAPGDYSVMPSAWLMIVSIVSFVLLVRAYRRTMNQIRRRQMRVFILAFAMYLATGIVCDIVVYNINPNALPPMSFFYASLLSVTISYGVARYGIFRITPTSLAEPVLESLAEGVLGINTDFEVEFVNEEATKIFGVTDDRLQGKQVASIVGEHNQQELVRGIGHSLVKFVLDDVEVKNQNGQTIPVTFTISKVFNERHRLSGYVLIVQNVTELKRKTIELAREKASVEQKVLERTKELHEEQAKLKASIDGLALGFLLLDPDGKVIIQNSALHKILSEKRTGAFHDAQEVAAQLGDDLDFTTKLQKAIARRKAIDLKSIDAADKTLHVFMSPVLVGAGSDSMPIGAVVLIEDITEATVLERSRDEFFSIASHELRTPLSAIRGNASIVLDQYADVLKKHGIDDYVSDIHDATLQLIEIVNDFLNLSELEQGKVLFRYEDVSIPSLIDLSIKNTNDKLRQAGVNVRYDKKQIETLAPLHVDKSKAAQVLYNLLSNAAKYSDDGKTVLIEAVAQPGDCVKISVTDYGRGIPPESRKLLFHKFQQASKSILTRDTERGTGVGLYISKLIAEAMHGSLQLERSEVGKGSTFSLVLPTVAREDIKVSRAPKVDIATGLTIKE